MPNGTLYPVTLVALYTQLVGGDPVDVSLKNIVNGATQTSCSVNHLLYLVLRGKQ